IHCHLCALDLCILLPLPSYYSSVVHRHQSVVCPAFFFYGFRYHSSLHSFPTRRSSDLISSTLKSRLPIPPEIFSASISSHGSHPWVYLGISVSSSLMTDTFSSLRSSWRIALILLSSDIPYVLPRSTSYPLTMTSACLFSRLARSICSKCPTWQGANVPKYIPRSLISVSPID